MKRQDYYPSVVEAQVLWLRSFAHALPQHAAALRIAAEDLADAIADALWVAYTLGPWRSAVRSFSKAATSALEAVQTGPSRGTGALPIFTVPPTGDDVVPRPDGALKRVFRFVQIIKASPGYTEAIGRALTVLTIADARTHTAPSLEVSVERGAAGEEAVLKMEKWGHTALCIEGRRGDGDWEELRITTEITLRDARPLLVPTQPELREYRARFYEDSAAIGEWSPVATVTISP